MPIFSMTFHEAVLRSSQLAWIRCSFSASKPIQHRPRGAAGDAPTAIAVRQHIAELAIAMRIVHMHERDLADQLAALRDAQRQLRHTGRGRRRRRAVSRTARAIPRARGPQRR